MEVLRMLVLEPLLQKHFPSIGDDHKSEKPKQKKGSADNKNNNRSQETKYNDSLYLLDWLLGQSPRDIFDDSDEYQSNTPDDLEHVPLPVLTKVKNDDRAAEAIRDLIELNLIPDESAVPLFSLLAAVNRQILQLEKVVDPRRRMVKDKAYVLLGDKLVPKDDIIASSASSESDSSPIDQPAVSDSNPIDRPAVLLCPSHYYALRQRVVGYRLGEIAEVKPVMAQETTLQRRELREKTELETISEQEVTDVQERSNEIKERSELKEEIGRTVQESVSTASTISAEGSYNSVSVSGSVKASSSRNAQQATQASEKHARAVTSEAVSRAVSKVTSRQLARRTQRLTREISQIFEHKIGPIDKPTDGIYRWLDKVCQSALFNLGPRLVLQVIVPEPARLIKWAMVNRENERTPQRPPDFELTADDINERNYQYLLARYPGVKRDDTPQPTYPSPPEMYVARIGKTFATTGNRLEAPWPQENQKDVPDPKLYEIVGIQLRGVRSGQSGTNSTEMIFLGEELTFTGLYFSRFVPVSLSDLQEFNLVHIMYNVTRTDTTPVVLYRRKAVALDEWRAKMLGLLKSNYLEAMREYEAARERNLAYEERQREHPRELKRRVRDELKRLCITLIRGEEVDNFGSIEQDKESTRPIINQDKAKAQRKDIVFWETAFDWENMVYQLFSYFWTRPEQWPNNLLLTDADDSYAAFLRAGACQVYVPVAPKMSVLVADECKGWGILPDDKTKPKSRKSKPKKKATPKDVTTIDAPYGSAEYVTAFAEIVAAQEDSEPKDSEPEALDDSVREFTVPTTMLCISELPGEVTWPKGESGLARQGLTEWA